MTAFAQSAKTTRQISAMPGSATLTIDGRVVAAIESWDIPAELFDLSLINSNYPSAKAAADRWQPPSEGPEHA